MHVSHDSEPRSVASRFDTYIPGKPYLSLDEFIDGAHCDITSPWMPDCTGVLHGQSAAHGSATAVFAQYIAMQDIALPPFDLLLSQPGIEQIIPDAVLFCCQRLRCGGAGESTNGVDLVGWVMAGVQHIPRSEDVPVVRP